MEEGFLDLHQSKKWAEYMQSIGWIVEELGVGENQIFAYVKKLPIGSVIKIQRPKVMPSTSEIDHLAKKHNALLVKVEPGVLHDLNVGALHPSTSSGQVATPLPGFRADSWPLLPTKELWIDLRSSEEEIFKSFSENARRNIKKITDLRFKIYEFGKGERGTFAALENFWRLLKETGERRGFFVEPYLHLESKARAFKDSGFLISACATRKLPQPVHDRGQVVVRNRGKSEQCKMEDLLLSGLFVLIHDEAAYYHFSATGGEGSEVNAPYLVLWEAIKEAKKRGCHTLNLEGIYDPRFPKFTKNWQGFSEFKSRFGGRVVEYPGSFSRWYLFGKSFSRLRLTC